MSAGVGTSRRRATRAGSCSLRAAASQMPMRTRCPGAVAAPILCSQPRASARRDDLPAAGAVARSHQGIRRRLVLPSTYPTRVNKLEAAPLSSGDNPSYLESHAPIACQGGRSVHKRPCLATALRLVFFKRFRALFLRPAAVARNQKNWSPAVPLAGRSVPVPSACGLRRAEAAIGAGPLKTM